MFRLSLINTPFGFRAITFKKRLTQIGVCFLASIFWSTMPLLGWSHYALENNLTSCSVEWNERSLNVTSYNVCLFFFGFIIPLAIILYSNLRIIYIVGRFENLSLLFSIFIICVFLKNKSLHMRVRSTLRYIAMTRQERS